MPTDPDDTWNPVEFFKRSRFSYRDADFGCGGMMCLRAGLPKDRVGLIFAMEGVKCFGSLADAQRYLRDELRGKGLIVAVQTNSQPTGLDGTPIDPDDLAEAGIDSRELIVPSAFNYATLLGTAENQFWEYANHGWKSEERLTTAKILHSGDLLRAKYTVYCVIPSNPKSLSTSPVARHGSGDRLGRVAEPTTRSPGNAARRWRCAGPESLAE
ncbi:MAG TPA: hypothetical protein EYH34_19450 [Planctomycetes bacterium]|nr:hypothetical protein [Planctomycetota bacterium]